MQNKTLQALPAWPESPLPLLDSHYLHQYSELSAAFGYLLKSICYFGAASIIGVYLVQLTQIVSFALFASASVYYTGEMVGEEDRTTGQSLTASVIVMGNVVGSLLGGVIIDGLGVKHLLLINIGMAVIGTIIALLSLSKRFEKR